jgi:hypothetical protein
LGYAFEIRFRVDVPVEFNKLNFMLQTFRLGDSDYYFMFDTGPFCNNNLGTTEGPFDSLGMPVYPGMVSDTASGIQGGNVLTDYYVQALWPYPHTESTLHGGSGVGRDRIGAYSTPYAFDIAQSMFSDNPNNCARPADACTVAGVQDGNPDFIGVSAMCEYPNKSNDSDDSTYKISSRDRSGIYPYMYIDFSQIFDHVPHP